MTIVVRSGTGVCAILHTVENLQPHKAKTISLMKDSTVRIAVS